MEESQCFRPRSSWFRTSIPWLQVRYGFNFLSSSPIKRGFSYLRNRQKGLPYLYATVLPHHSPRARMWQFHSQTNIQTGPDTSLSHNLSEWAKTAHHNKPICTSENRVPIVLASEVFVHSNNNNEYYSWNDTASCN